MTSFVALNVEPESDSEEEIDDTKEIQIEEALKLYQNALKFHSQGPAFFEEADAAYNALFNSEIFRYPEAFSEFERAELNRDILVDDLDAEDTHDALPVNTVVPPSGSDGTANTLQQVLYLYYKNHAQLLLERLSHQLSSARDSSRQSGVLKSNDDSQIHSIALDGLDLFAQALDKDDTDPDLWRRTSRIGGLLGSKRIARFCLEAVLRSESQNDSAWREPPGFEEKLAMEQLRKLLASIQDRHSESQVPISLQKHKKVPNSLKKFLDVFPQLPTPSDEILSQLPNEITVQTLLPPESSWAAVGQTILGQAFQECNGKVDPPFGTSYLIQLPRENDVLDNTTVASVNARVPLSRKDPTKPINHQTPSLVENCLSNSQIMDIPVDHSQKHFGSEIRQTLSSPDDVPLTENIETVQRQIQFEGSEIALQNSSIMPPSLAVDRSGATLDLGSASASMSLPTRKRNSESAGLQEPGDNGRVRSKRIRARAELAPDEESIVIDSGSFFEDRLQESVQADLLIYGLTDQLLSRLGIQDIVSISELRHAINFGLIGTPGNIQSGSPVFTALRDIKEVLLTWNLDTSNLFLHGSGPTDPLGQADQDSNSGIAFFHAYSNSASRTTSSRSALLGDAGLAGFVTAVNSSQISLSGLAVLFITELLKPKIAKPAKKKSKNRKQTSFELSSSYRDSLWSEALKEALVQLLVLQDEHLFKTIRSQFGDLENRLLISASQMHNYKFGAEDEKLVEFVQTIFEMHLDIYGVITNPSSSVEQDKRETQRDRLKRWATLSSQAVKNRYEQVGRHDITEPLNLRYLWSSAMYVRLMDTDSREHIILCFQDLKKILEESGSPVIYLQNNAVIPEVSAKAIDREISKLTTMDFILGIFDPNNQDPLTVVETLEPILSPFNHLVPHNSTQSDLSDEYYSAIENHGEAGEAHVIDNMRQEDAQTTESLGHSKVQDVIEVLGKANISLRLFLWRKLRTSYDRIQYPPMVLLCNLKSIELILVQMRSSSYENDTLDVRMGNIVTWIRTLEDLMTRSLEMAMSDTSVFGCMDEENLKTALRSCVELTRVLHIFALWEDSIRVGQSLAPVQPSGPATAAYRESMIRLKEMQIKTWMLQYFILKESMNQNSDLFPTPKEDLADCLKMIHHVLGLRQYCKLLKKSFLTFAKSELLHLRPSESWEADMGQIIFDLYGLKVCPRITQLADHGCPPDAIDQSSTLEIMSFVMFQTESISMKDLLKTDLKNAIDKMQGSIGAPPKLPSLNFNRRIISAHLKTPINPVHIYRALQGVGGLSGTPVKHEHTLIAKKGWYFLLGYMTLTKFRSQKRTSPSPTDDLDFAITFFKLDLEFDMERWETWYRLAQTYDAKIEEDITWTADKLNNKKEDLVTLERNAIHCYTMAVSAAIRCADANFETVEKMSDLYADFGTRIYASSQQPFFMAVFSLEGYKKYRNTNLMSTFKSEPFRSLRFRSAWVLAAALFRQALLDKPQRWSNWYLLGKCLWKQHVYPDIAERSPVTYREVVDAFTKAIEFVPEKRDSRHPDKDPILEPHYKLVSIVYKLVQKMKAITPDEGCRFLDATPYARKVPHVTELEDWETYILQVLKGLRAADKSNWHHRMVARAAHVIYDDSQSDLMAARGVKHELTQQIFTKTMTIQVWKPENERPGRHFVYTSRYVSFFLHILYQLGDRASIEALGKRVRKKPGDFVNHVSLWTEVCTFHMVLLRNQSGIVEGHSETILSSLPLENFLLNTTRLETWIHTPTTPTTLAAPVLEALREACELKKTNANLMKATPIDDLIADIFARLYELVIPDLVSKVIADENRDRMRVDHLLMNPSPQPPPPVEPQQPAPDQDQQPLVRSRPKTVGKRDILRRADAIVAKPSLVTQPPPKPKTPTSTSAAPMASAQVSAVTVQSLVPGRVSEVQGEAREEGGGKEVISSVPGSVHDSADDESELSEIEEDEVEGVGEAGGGDEEEGREEKGVRVMFPGLMGRNGGDEEGNEGGVGGDEDGDETVDENEGEEEGDNEGGGVLIEEDGKDDINGDGDGA